MKATRDQQLGFCSSFTNKGYSFIFSSFSCRCGCTMFINLQLQNIARERDERKGASTDFISLTSHFQFIDESRKYSENLTPLLSWIHLIEVHQNVAFEMEKNRWGACVTDNRCKTTDCLSRTLGLSRIGLFVLNNNRTIREPTHIQRV